MWTDPTPAEVKTDDGHTYYVDPVTNEASWEKPARFAWQEVESDKHAGRTYWFNTVRSIANINESCGASHLIECVHVGRLRPTIEVPPPPFGMPNCVSPLQVTKESSWEKPEGAAWKKMATNSLFYYNQLTGAPSTNAAIPG